MVQIEQELVAVPVQLVELRSSAGRVDFSVTVSSVMLRTEKTVCSTSLLSTFQLKRIQTDQNQVLLL